MEIELITRPVFDLKIGDAVFKDFTVLSEWEGFKKLHSARHGTVILTVKGAQNDFSKVFDFLLSEKAAEEPKQKVVIVRASPDILAALSENEAKGGEA